MLFYSNETGLFELNNNKNNQLGVSVICHVFFCQLLTWNSFWGKVLFCLVGKCHVPIYWITQFVILVFISISQIIKWERRVNFQIIIEHWKLNKFHQVPKTMKMLIEKSFCQKLYLQRFKNFQIYVYPKIFS